MLGAGDPLPHRPRRILVAGVTGVGKTTLAARIAEVTGSPHTEIDALYHGPGWTYRESFLDEVDELTSRPAWVTEWQYRSARATLASRADTLVWLDLPARVALPRLVRRTVRRRLRREQLWNGNYEPPLWHFLTGRDHILRWALQTQRKYKRTVPVLEADATTLTIVRLRSQREVERWLAGPLADAARAESPPRDDADAAEARSRRPRSLLGTSREAARATARRRSAGVRTRTRRRGGPRGIRRWGRRRRRRSGGPARRSAQSPPTAGLG